MEEDLNISQPQPAQPKKKSGIDKKMLMIILAMLVLGGVAYGTYSFTKQQVKKEADATASELQAQLDELKKSAAKESSKQGELTYDASKLIDYGEDPIYIESQSDIVELAGVSDTFKEFISSELFRINRESRSNGCNEAASISLSLIYDDSFATGGTASCGGAAALWAKDADGNWSQVSGTQNVGFQCSQLVKYKVPHQVAGKYCWSNSDVRRYENFEVGEIISTKTLEKELRSQQ